MEAAQVERAGINLKPSGRVRDDSAAESPIEVGKTVGDITVPDPIFSCRDVDVYYGDKQAIKKLGIDIGKNQVLPGGVPILARIQSEQNTGDKVSADQAQQIAKNR